MEPVRVGVIGCGAISAQYLSNARRYPVLEVTACADLDPARARARAAEFGVPRVESVERLLAAEDVEVVLNLTVPRAHASLALQALESGKHTFLEKPLAVSREEAERIRAAAVRTGLRVGCAPDTFLGAGLQTARALVDRGVIGRPVAFAASMMSRGHEAWHPDPAFFYQPGGGPMLDMGPYYVTALLNMLGAVRRQCGFTAIALPERIVTSQPRAGERIRVEVPDHVCALLEFEQGAIGTLVTSFATPFPQHDRSFPITVWGSEGVLRVPDPNQFDGPVQVRLLADEEFVDVPHTHAAGHGRSVGLADMAEGIRTGRPHRCSLEQAFAVLDLMLGVQESSDAGAARTPAYPYVRPDPMAAEV